jgi:lipopolysaccharide transport system permease protein
LPIVVVLSHLVHFALALPILLSAILAFAIFAKFHITMAILLTPFLMILQTLFVGGIALAVSSASVLFRDVRDITANLMHLGFFITPIIYTIDKIDMRFLRALLRLNPMTPFVVAYQDVLFWGRIPSLSDTLLMIAYAFASLSVGFFVFDRLRDTLAEAL